MKKYKSSFLSRLVGLKHLLTSKNFILIYHIKKGTDKNGEKFTTTSVHRRTDFDAESDRIAMIGGLVNCFPEELEKFKP